MRITLLDCSARTTTALTQRAKYDAEKFCTIHFTTKLKSSQCVLDVSESPSNSFTCFNLLLMFFSLPVPSFSTRKKWQNFFTWIPNLPLQRTRIFFMYLPLPTNDSATRNKCKTAGKWDWYTRLVLHNSFTLNQSLNQFKSGFSVLFKGRFCIEWKNKQKTHLTKNRVTSS